MRLSERLAIGTAIAAAAILFVAARYLPEYVGDVEPDHPKMTAGQSAWLLLAPAAIIVALALGRRMAGSERMRVATTVAVAIAAVAVLASYLWLTAIT